MAQRSGIGVSGIGAPATAAEPSVETTVLVVPGMHCAGCMSKVEKGLVALPGVNGARVNLTARQVRVAHDATVTIPDMVDALARIGFPAQPRGADLTPPPSAVKPLLSPLGVAAFAAMNVMLLSVSIWSGADGATRDLFHWLSALIGVPAVIYSGRVFFASAWGALKHGRTNMDVPISIGVTLATGLSSYETLTHGREAWFDGTLMLLLFLLAGRALDAMMRDRARTGVDALLRQAASGAMVVGQGGVVEWLAAADLVPGMVMRVASGERLAADGAIAAGTTSFDRSLLTGESAPVPGTVGDAVVAGMLNLGAPVDVTVTATGEDTSLAEIARLMETAGQHRSTYVRIADRASRLYAPCVHTLALASFIGWMVSGAGWYHSLVIAIAVLIITCPCALGVECSILSGDTTRAVGDVARLTGLTAQAAASPADKQEAIIRLKQAGPQGAGRQVLMAGDGLNDGPALAAADASIAPGTASDVGRQAADFVFLGDSLMALPRAVAVSKATMRVVRQNFILAVGYNALAVPLAIAGKVTPLLAAVAMSTSSLLVIANSLRLAIGPRWQTGAGQNVLGEKAA